MECISLYDTNTHFCQLYRCINSVDLSNIQQKDKSAVYSFYNYKRSTIRNVYFVLSGPLRIYIILGKLKIWCEITEVFIMP